MEGKISYIRLKPHPLEMAVSTYKRGSNNAIASFSLPSFNQNFVVEEGIKHPELLAVFKEQLELFQTTLEKVVSSP